MGDNPMKPYMIYSLIGCAVSIVIQKWIERKRNERMIKSMIRNIPHTDYTLADDSDS